MKNKNKVSNRLLIYVIIFIILITASLFFITKSKTRSIPISSFNGIYKDDDTKIYIHEINEKEAIYTIDGNGFFNGTAKLNNTTLESDDFNFSLENDSLKINVKKDTIYIKEKKYKKVLEYSRENVYKEAIGNASYLSSKYNGLFTLNDIEIVLYQISDKNIAVRISDKNSVNINEIFEIYSNDEIRANSFINDNNFLYRIIFNNDSSITILCNHSAGEFTEELKIIEGNYSKKQAVTMDYILDNYYKTY